MFVLVPMWCALQYHGRATAICVAAGIGATASGGTFITSKASSLKLAMQPEIRWQATLHCLFSSLQNYQESAVPARTCRDSSKDEFLV